MTMKPATTDEWVSLTAGDLAKDLSLVQRGDLIEYELWETPDGPARYRAVIKVAAIWPGSQLEICGHRTLDYFEEDGSTSRLRPYFGSVYTAGWDPIRVLRGGAPEIFEGERVAEVQAALQSYADGTGTFDEVREAVDAAVFSVGMGPGRNVEEIYRFADEAPWTNRCTFDSVLWLPLLEKTITMEQRAELAAIAHFTIGGRGRPRRPDDSGEST